MQPRPSEVTVTSRDAPVIHRNRPLIITVAALGVALALGIPAATAVRAGAAPYEAVNSGFPGLGVAVATSVVHAIAALSSIATAGSLVVVMFVRDASGRDASRIAASPELTLVRVASAVWSLSAAALIVLESADANGVPLSRLNEPGALSYLISASDHPKAWTITFVLSALVWLITQFATRWTTLLIPLWATAFGLLAPAAVGQLLVGRNHDIGGDSGYIVTLAASVCFGILLTAAFRTVRGRPLPPRVVKRFLGVTAVSLAAMIIADPVVSLFKLDGHFASITGAQLAVHSALLVLSAAAVATVLLRLRAGRLSDRVLVRFFVFTSLIAATWVGVDVAQRHIPPPNYFVETSIAEVYMGFETPDVPTASVLFTQWRVNVLFLAIALVAVGVYLIAVRRLHRRGDAWPVGRTIAWISGWAVVVFVTSSGFGKYSAPDFGIHMIGHMTLNMAAPMLLVLGGILTLMLRAWPPSRTAPAGIHEWISWMLAWKPLRIIFNPLLVFISYVASYYGLYFSPIFGDYMRYHWAHQLMNLHFVVIGYLFYALVIGVDRPPRPLPHIGKLGYVLAAMPFHAFFGVILMTSNDIVAETFYRYLDMPWADLQASQYVGGGVAWAGGEIPLMIVIVVLAVQWSRQDRREAQRKDRHFDLGRDDEFDEYNAMLGRLMEQQSRVDAASAHPSTDSASPGETSHTQQATEMNETEATR